MALAVPGAAAIQGGTLQTDIRCDFPGELIEAGDTAVFDLAVTNRGETGTCLLNFWTFRGTDGWKIRFEAGDREVYRMLIPAGETKTVRLVAETAGHAAVGEYPIRVGSAKADLGLCPGHEDPRGEGNPRGHRGRQEGNVVKAPM